MVELQTCAPSETSVLALDQIVTAVLRKELAITDREDELASALCGHFNISTKFVATKKLRKQPPLSSYFLQDFRLENLDAKERQLLSSLFLRLLIESGFSWLLDSQWRPTLIRLFDDTLQENVYQDVQVDCQSHEKIANLQAHRQRIEEQFRSNLCLSSLNQVQTQQTKLMKTLKTRSGQMCLSIWLPSNWEQVLSEVYRALRSYSESRQNLDALDSYRKADAEIVNAYNVFVSHGSSYSLDVASSLLQRMQGLLGSF